jgi:hypothetical protein
MSGRALADDDLRNSPSCKVTGAPRVLPQFACETLGLSGGKMPEEGSPVAFDPTGRQPSAVGLSDSTFWIVDRLFRPVRRAEFSGPLRGRRCGARHACDNDQNQHDPESRHAEAAHVLSILLFQKTDMAALAWVRPSKYAALHTGHDVLVNVPASPQSSCCTRHERDSALALHIRDG